MKKDVKRFIYQGTGDQSYYFAPNQNDKQVLVLNNIFRKNDISDISLAYLEIKCKNGASNISVYWDKTGDKTDFSNLETDAFIEKLDFISQGNTTLKIDVTRVFAELQRYEEYFKNQRFIIVGDSFIPENADRDYKMIVYYDHKRGFKERTATVPFETQNVKGFVDLSDNSVHFDVVDTVGSGRMPISVKHHYNSNSRYVYDNIYLENGVKKTVNYLCGCGFKLNYQQFLIVDSVQSGTLSDGESNAYYTWIDSKGNYIHFAQNATSGAISCEQPFVLEKNGAYYEITDISGNKLIFEVTGDLSIYRLKYIKDNFNNTITLSYDGMFLTEISSSSGDLVRINYDGDTNLMLNMVEVLDNDTQIVTNFSTNGDPSLTDVISQGGNNDVHFHCGHYYDEEKEEDIYYVNAVYGANGVGYFFDYQSATHLKVYSIGTTDGIENGSVVEKTYDNTKSFLGNCNNLLLYSNMLSDRKARFTKNRNEEAKDYLFDYFGRCVSQYENKFDGSESGNPQAGSISLTPSGYSVKAENVFNADDLIRHAYQKPSNGISIDDLFTDEQKADADKFISVYDGNSTADSNVYFAESSQGKLLPFVISGSRFYKLNNSGTEIKSPNDYLLSAWALADSYPIKEYAKGLKVNDKTEQVLKDTSLRRQEIYGSNFYADDRKFELCADVVYSYEEGEETDTFSSTFDPSNKKLQYLFVPIRLRPNDKTNIDRVEVYVRYSNNKGGIYLFGASLKSANWSFEQYNNDKQIVYSRSSEKESYYTENSFNAITKLPESVSIIIEDGSQSPYVQTFSYNANKSLSSVSDSKGFITEYVYDTVNNNGDLLKKKTFKRIDDQDTYAFVEEQTYYSATGEIKEKYNSTGDIAMTYNYANGVLASTTHVNSSTINYAYDSTYKFVNSISSTVNNKLNKNNTAYLKGVEISHDDITSSENSGGSHYAYDYDGFGRITSIKIDGEAYCTIEYTSENQKVVTYANGEREKINLSKNDTHADIYQTDNPNSWGSTTIEMSFNKYGYFKQLEDNISKTKIKATYDDRGCLSKMAVENKDDHFYDVIIKNEYDKTGKVTSRTYEQQNDDADVADYFYQNEYNGKVTSIGHSYIDTEFIDYDDLKRVSRYSKSGDDLVVDYTYVNGENNVTSELIASEEHSNYYHEDYIDKYNYEYDALGRLTQVTNNDILSKKYTYDGLGRLVREDNRDLNKTFVFTYDNAGNILSRKEYNFTTNETLPTTPDSIYTYSYDSSNKNHLTDYTIEINGENPITESVGSYELGNPWTYRGKSATWKNVHRLASYDGITFDYNYAGIRTKKTVNGITIKYGINGSTIVSEQKGTDATSRITYYYGFDGVTAFKYGGQYYYYQKNAFGDIIGIFDNNDDLVAKYVYDAWGNHKVLNPNNTENTSATFIGNINPFRYRSYYFDVETGFYYLQSRYYDPEVGRFISMDAIEYLDPKTINGLNLYAYCLNDPVNKSDPTGTFPVAALIICAVLIVGVAVLCTSDSIIEEIEPESSITESDLNIDGNNPNASIKVEIKKGSISIEESYKITNEVDRKKVIEIIMGSEKYAEYGYYRTAESYLSEWNAHNFAFSVLPEGEMKERARHVDLNKDPEGGFFGFLYRFF